METIKLSEYVKRHKVTYRTVWNQFKAGKIPGAYKDELGNILVEVEDSKSQNLDTEGKIAIYARVSSPQNKKSRNTDTTPQRVCRGKRIYRH